MRYLMLFALVACGSTAGSTQDLPGTWDSVDNQGELVDGPVQTEWVFDENGSYRLEDALAGGSVIEEGTWQPVDDDTIRRSTGELTEMRVSDDGNYFLIDPEILTHDKWQITRDHVCDTTGTQSVLVVHADHTAQEHWQCDTRTYDCTGTWEDKGQLGITISWESMSCSPVDYLFRIRDGLGYPGFRRVAI